MSMSDCPKCWDTPCTCGFAGYKLVYDNQRCSTCKERTANCTMCKISKQSIDKNHYCFKWAKG